MFKAIGLALALIAGVDALSLQSHGDDVQKAADAFFRDKVANLKDATLTGGEQNGNNFQYQYLRQTAPVTITKVVGDRVDETNNTFRLKSTLQTLSGPVEGGRLTRVVQTSSYESLDRAVSDLKWK